MSRDWIPFHLPWRHPDCPAVLKAVAGEPAWGGGGVWTRRAEERLAAIAGGVPCLLTQSCTSALEMAALLMDLAPGDEVIMPSWTFPSSANAIVLRGAVPVFVDVQAGTLNLDPALVEAALTSRTRAIMVVHYGGVPADMAPLQRLCQQHQLWLIEDAAQALGSRYGGRPAGTLGALGAVSFHDTKNISCGEGGALFVNRSELLARAEQIRDKGTNRQSWQRAEVARYEWVTAGSSCLPSEVTAALLHAQLQGIEPVTTARKAIWQSFARELNPDRYPDLGLPVCASDREHNGHGFHLVLPEPALMEGFLTRMRTAGVECKTHYHALHLSIGGLRYGREGSSMDETMRAHAGLARLPLWPGMTEQQVTRVREAAVLALADIGYAPVAGLQAQPAPLPRTEDTR